ncbi:ankyrin repeat domain-containing protein 53 [Paroedura picta]|uniref:ankyrin repeat domain-containing protein 53 n=1 Tax=Paroedura picta TaxID=143630 RepID=UPI0040574111
MAAPKRKPSRPTISFAKSSSSVIPSAAKSAKPEVLNDELYAACTGEVHWLQMTLQKSECPTQADINGFSALHTAALFGRLDCLKMLVEKYGVSVDLASRTGWRPLHLVMNKESGNRALECLKYLISKDADVNAQNQNGVSPLHKAASEGRTNCVKLLIEAGADVHAKDIEGQEPIDLCRMWGHRECAKYLSFATWRIDKENVSREISRLNEIKKECLAREEESQRKQQVELNRFNHLLFLEWLEKKGLPPPSARILRFLEKRVPSVTLRRHSRRPGSTTGIPGEIRLLYDFEKDRWPQPWNASPNPASLPTTRIFRPHTIRLGVSPDPSVDEDFSSFVFLSRSRYGEPEIRMAKGGVSFPLPDLSWQAIQRRLYPHAWPSRLKVPQGFKPQHILDVQRKRPPSPAHRWTDQMAVSLRQTLDPAFVATLKAHLATYSDAELDCGGSQEPSSPP